MASVSSLATATTPPTTWNMSCLKAALPPIYNNHSTSVRLPVVSSPSNASAVKFSFKANPISLRSFHGLAPLHPLLSLGTLSLLSLPPLLICAFTCFVNFLCFLVCL